jgi:ribosome-binding factor A
MRSADRAGASQRQLRVGEEIRHILAEVLMRGDIHDPDLQNATITVTEVSVSPDLKNATVYVLPLGGIAGASGPVEGGDVMAGLKRAAPYLRTVVSKRITLRQVPRLVFALDTGFETASRIDKLLRAPEVVRDLTPPAEEKAGAEEKVGAEEKAGTGEKAEDGAEEKARDRGDRGDGA